jgi:hypothetical protein
LEKPTLKQRREIMHTNWKQVTKAEFYAVVGRMDVVPHILPGPFPYTTIFQNRAREPIGRITGAKTGFGNPIYSLSKAGD